MSNLDRDFSERSIDHNHKMEKFKEGEFSGWDNTKYTFGIPLLLSLLIASIVTVVVSLWGSWK